MTYSDFDKLMMRRALMLAKNGRGRVSPNPMVGAVITVGEKVIGEGWHRMWGGPHAEVNAVNSVREADRSLLHEATVYVTLEPCSHYGKTPPCADMLAALGVKRVVVATLDPFLKVRGRGVARLRDAGIIVETGLYEEDARELNRRFITAHTLHRPFVQLKWAQSADGYMARNPGDERVIFSNPISTAWMHRERSIADAVMVGVNTVLTDNPKLDCRLWPGRTPAAVTADFTLFPPSFHIFDGRKLILRKKDEPLIPFLSRLYSDLSVTSLMVEGGVATLNEFIREGIYDEIRVETAPILLREGVKAPDLTNRKLKLVDIFQCKCNKIAIFRE